MSLPLRDGASKCVETGMSRSSEISSAQCNLPAQKCSIYTPPSPSNDTLSMGQFQVPPDQYIETQKRQQLQGGEDRSGRKRRCTYDDSGISFLPVQPVAQRHFGYANGQVERQWSPFTAPTQRGARFFTDYTTPSLSEQNVGEWHFAAGHASDTQPKKTQTELFTAEIVAHDRSYDRYERFKKRGSSVDVTRSQPSALSAAYITIPPNIKRDVQQIRDPEIVSSLLQVAYTDVCLASALWRLPKAPVEGRSLGDEWSRSSHETGTLSKSTNAGKLTTTCYSSLSSLIWTSISGNDDNFAIDKWDLFSDSISGKK